MATVSGNVKTLTTGALTAAKVRFFLTNYTGIARVIGTGALAQPVTEVESDANGAFSLTLYGNDVIDPAGTFYSVFFTDLSTGRTIGPVNFNITGATFDLNSAPPVTSGQQFAPAGVLSNLNTRILNQIRLADQFPGADAGAKIAAALADLPSTGGIVDARGLLGPQSGAGFTIPANVTLILGEIDLVISSPIAMSKNSALIGRVAGAVKGPSESGAGTFQGGTRIFASASFPPANSGSGASLVPSALVYFNGSAFNNNGAFPVEANLVISDVQLWGNNIALYGFWADRFSEIKLYRVTAEKMTVDGFHLGDTITDAVHSYMVDAEALYANGAVYGANYLVKADQVVFRDCKCDNNLYGLRIIASTETKFLHGHLESSTSKGVSIEGSSGSNIAIADSTIIVAPSATIGIDLGGPDGGASQPVTIKNNLILGRGAALSAAINNNGDRHVIVGNDIQNWPTGIYAGGRQAMMIANAIKTTTAGTGIHIPDPLNSNHIILGNAIVTNGGTSISGPGNNNAAAAFVLNNFMDSVTAGLLSNEIPNNLHFGELVSFSNGKAIMWQDTATPPANHRYALVSGANAQIGDIDNFGWELFVMAGASRPINFRQGAALPMVINSAGQVGIGTPSPAALLDINGTLKVGASGTAITQIRVYTPNLTPSSVGAQTVAEQTFTVTGLTTADKVIVNPPAISNATGIAGFRVSAADTLAIRFVNPTTGALTPSSGTYTVIAFRS